MGNIQLRRSTTHNTVLNDEQLEQLKSHVKDHLVTDALIIGISGCTRSGKSTLAKSLFEHLKQQFLVQQQQSHKSCDGEDCDQNCDDRVVDSNTGLNSSSSSNDNGIGDSNNNTLFIKLKLLEQDRYFCFRKPIHAATQYENWECPESVDFERMETAMNEFLHPAQEDFSLRCGQSEERFIIPLHNVPTAIPTMTTGTDDDTNMVVTHEASSTTPVDAATTSLRSDTSLSGSAVLNDGKMNSGSVKPPAAIRKILIIEGFLLFTYPAIINQCHALCFLHIDKALCKDRRQRTTTVPDDYFERVLWPSYCTHNKRLIHRSQFVHNTNVPILHMEGSRAPEDIFTEVLQEIAPLIDKVLKTDN